MCNHYRAAFHLLSVDGTKRSELFRFGVPFMHITLSSIMKVYFSLKELEMGAWGKEIRHAPIISQRNRILVFEVGVEKTKFSMRPQFLYVIESGQSKWAHGEKKLSIRP